VQTEDNKKTLAAASKLISRFPGPPADLVLVQRGELTQLRNATNGLMAEVETQKGELKTRNRRARSRRCRTSARTPAAS